MNAVATMLITLAAHAPVVARDTPIDLKIAPGKVGEVCMPLKAGDTLAWQFKVSAATDFNLHHHIGKKVLMPVQRRAVMEDRGRHSIDRRNEWCLMWTSPPEHSVTVQGSWRASRAASK